MIPPVPAPEAGPELRRETIAWFVRRGSPDWLPVDEAAFHAWLAASAEHAAMHAQWQARWQALDGLPADAVAGLRARLARDQAFEAAAQAPAAAPGFAPAGSGVRQDRPPTAVGLRRRHLLASALGAAAACAVVSIGSVALWQHLQAQPLYAQEFQSQRGQQLQVPLPDGSSLRLDTATRLAVRYHRGRREVRLLEGQAVFEVRAEPGRPFHVLAGAVRVTVTGTRFSVRHTPGAPGAAGVQVAVEEGSVRVARFDAGRGEEHPESVVLLTSGRQMLADADGTPGPPATVAAAGIAPWREQRLSFVDTPLATVLAELERYADTGLVVHDPAVAALRLSGTFDPRDAATLKRTLPRSLPVALRDAPGGVAEVVRAK